MGTITESTIKSAQAGDREAFEAIYDAYYERVARYATRRVLDPVIAEDIAAHVWLKVISKLSKFKWQHEHSFTGWIFRIANNEVNQYFRKGARYKTVALDEMEQAIIDDAAEERRLKFEKSLDRNDQYLVMHRHISQLPRKQQDIIHLYYFEKLSHKEIAVALNMKHSAVRAAASRALAKLHKQLKSQPEFANMEI